MRLRLTTGITILVVVLISSCCVLADDSGLKKRGPWSNLTSTRARVEFLENPAWKAENQPDRVLKVIGVKPGDVVADVGSGTGLYTFPLADKVGKNGKVYAVDILDDMLDYIDRKMKKEGVQNVELVKSSESDPHLPPSSCDTIIMANTYRHIGDKLAFFRKLRESLRKGGSIVIISVDRYHKDSETYTKSEQRIISEMKLAGFDLSHRYVFLNNHHFLIFT